MKHRMPHHKRVPGTRSPSHPTRAAFAAVFLLSAFGLWRIAADARDRIPSSGTETDPSVASDRRPSSTSSTSSTSSDGADGERWTVHEWGTFTTVHGADGSRLPGLEVEEEALPAFVHSHNGMAAPPPAQFSTGLSPANLITLGRKGFSRPLSNVTVKMETPVLYFYSDRPRTASVEVGFRGGSISQWYPQRTGGEIPPALSKDPETGQLLPLDFGEPYQGSIEWSIYVEERNDADDFRVMKAGETINWLHPRAPQSNVVRTPDGQSEKYLFYRGVGNFALPLHLRFEDADTVRLETSEEIPFVLLYEHRGDGARIWWRGPLSPGESQPVSVSLGKDGPPLHQDAEREVLYDELHHALVSAGLYEDEAGAMLRTWWHSYTELPGLRAFWIVPRSFTDTILPLQIEPAPKELERVLLGRSELLRPQFEESLTEAFEGEEGESAYTWHRFRTAFRSRAEALKNQVQTVR